MGDFSTDYDPYEWDDPDFDTDHECEHCREDALCAFTVDPYLDEVFPEEGPHLKSWWCRKCWEDRKDEV